ncbi:RES family NAD+ phosphorylase [Leptospira licerasiae]|uniref:RES family NAD+ phosphorylase n=1 Tax=Leptospira licerasiae TaxID=447106 RepID=UPI0030198750
MPTKIEKARSYIEKEIRFCEQCQPHSEGDIIWIHGKRTELSYLLERFELTENQTKAVLKGFRCPYCTNYLQSLDNDVGIIHDYERENERRLHKIEENYFPKIEEFAEYLVKYPMLGLNHKVGRELFRAIQTLPTEVIQNEIWFRSRNAKKLRNPKSIQLLNPNPEKYEIKEGRYNHYGQSHFYCADEEDTALKEIFSKEDGTGWIQKFKIKYVNNILDITVDPDREDVPRNYLAGAMLFSRVLRRTVSKSTYWKPEYIVPRFVADLAKSLGFRGLIYSGSEHFGKNLVIFNLSENDFEFVDVPYKKKKKDTFVRTSL